MDRRRRGEKEWWQQAREGWVGACFWVQKLLKMPISHELQVLRMLMSWDERDVSKSKMGSLNLSSPCTPHILPSRWWRRWNDGLSSIWKTPCEAAWAGSSLLWADSTLLYLWFKHYKSMMNLPPCPEGDMFLPILQRFAMFSTLPRCMQLQRSSHYWPSMQMEHCMQMGTTSRETTRWSPTSSSWCNKVCMWQLWLQLDTQDIQHALRIVWQDYWKHLQISSSLAASPGSSMSWVGNATTCFRLTPNIALNLCLMSCGNLSTCWSGWNPMYKSC